MKKKIQLVIAKLNISKILKIKLIYKIVQLFKLSIKFKELIVNKMNNKIYS